MRTSIKFILLIIVLGLGLTGYQAYLSHMTDKQNGCLAQCTPVPVVEKGTTPPEAYYKALETNCCGDKGCLVSVDHMREIGAFVMPESSRCDKPAEENGQALNKCPHGTKPDSLLALGSYTWCEKE